MIRIPPIPYYTPSLGLLFIACSLTVVSDHSQRVFGAEAADLHAVIAERIDDAIESVHPVEAGALADDFAFVRRSYLDLLGRAPTAAEARQFAAKVQDHKRARLIDELLASDEFSRYFAGVLDIMLMERRNDKRVAQEDWLRFLEQAVADQWSLSRIAHAIVRADGTDGRGAAKFLLAREVEPNAVTRDIGRIFLGRDLQCAQCHDHPNIGDYSQREYYGILAFVNRSYLFEPNGAPDKALVGERAEGEAEFTSVFLPDDEPSRTAPFLLNELMLEIEPRLVTSNAYLVPPSKNTPAVPRFSRRGQLARLLTHPDNSLFARNMVNRLWAHMFGVGMVDPVDFHHDDNPPTHPSLLTFLARALVESDYDLRGMLRSIALSNAYQRSIELPSTSEASLAGVGEAIEALREAEPKQDTSAERARLSATLVAARLRLSRTDETIDAIKKVIGERDKEVAGVIKKIKSVGEQQAKIVKQIQALESTLEATNRLASEFEGDKDLASTSEGLAARKEKLDERRKKLAAEQKALEERRQALDDELAGLHRRWARLNDERLGWADSVAEARGALRYVRQRAATQDDRAVDRRQQIATLDGYRVWTEQNVAVVADLPDLAGRDVGREHLEHADAHARGGVGDEHLEAGVEQGRALRQRAVAQVRLERGVQQRLVADEHGLDGDQEGQGDHRADEADVEHPPPGPQHPHQAWDDDHERDEAGARHALDDGGGERRPQGRHQRRRERVVVVHQEREDHRRHDEHAGGPGVGIAEAAGGALAPGLAHRGEHARAPLADEGPQQHQQRHDTHEAHHRPDLLGLHRRVDEVRHRHEHEDARRLGVAGRRREAVGERQQHPQEHHDHRPRRGHAVQERLPRHQRVQAVGGEGVGDRELREGDGQARHLQARHAVRVEQQGGEGHRDGDRGPLERREQQDRRRHRRQGQPALDGRQGADDEPEADDDARPEHLTARDHFATLSSPPGSGAAYVA